MVCFGKFLFVLFFLIFVGIQNTIEYKNTERRGKETIDGSGSVKAFFGR